ncbi:MAG: hypothetical protein Q9211_003716 [Gyalolechia sp. 1 TL-2023]
MEPESELTRFPRIYADCEGLEGGEKMPVAHGWIEDSLLKKRSEMRLDETIAKKMREKAQRGLRRKLRWANTEEKRKREFTVRELYPRLLYTFSNVVVFVLANERYVISSSTNQSVLPHVIVVLNKSDDQLGEKDFDVDATTQKLLSDADQSLVVNASIQRHVRYWRSQGRDIRTARDLLACFYCTVNVVRIPRRGRWMLMDRQIKKLHELIASNCRGSHEGKLQARRDLNAEELGECLQSGLDHFTDDLDKPFDFLGFSWGLNPIAPGLGGNILRLALWVRDCAPYPRPEEIFDYLSHMVASCIMLDFVRYRKRGTPLELFEHYKPFLDGALHSFCDVWWPCSYENARGKRCVNTKEGHARGHQDEHGKPIGPGGYKSSFSADIYSLKWHSRLEEMLQEIHNSMVRRNLTNVSRSQNSEAREAADLHLTRMESFYSGLGGAQRFFSNVACLSCLGDMPEHPLPCGHVICTKCVRTFSSERLERREVEIKLKPDQAGVRILCLDGGGVRGIVELEVLREIERELGQNFRVQDFFDLIVGTSRKTADGRSWNSTGGIIALGIGVQNWSVEECIFKFKSLCGEAFTERELHGYPLLGKWAMVNHRSAYKSRPFEAALKNEFGQDDDLFGGYVHSKHYARHVAVTTTTGVGSEPRILSNYNRQKMENPEYTLERPEKRTSELKVWQAVVISSNLLELPLMFLFDKLIIADRPSFRARATSAAPPYFKTFRPVQSPREFADGAVHHNNPVNVANSERKYIWPDVDNLYPDLLLSIGTGKSSNHLEAEKTRQKKQEQEARWLRWVPKALQILFAKMHDVLDAEKTWQKFIETVPAEDAAQRYIRINPDLRFGVPNLDDKLRIGNLEKDTKNSLSYMNSSIRGIADRLVASCFYYEKASGQTLENQVLGRILCRFEDGSKNLRKLGKCLRSFQGRDFSPRFTVTEADLNPDPMYSVLITPKTIDDMVQFSKFSVAEPVIHISGPQAKITIAVILRDADPPVGLPISGFPRQLKYEDEIKATRQKTTREAIRHAQSKLHLRSPSPYRSVSNSSLGGKLRFSVSPSSEYHKKRPNSAPEAAALGLDGANFPESADDVQGWIERQQEEPSAVELQGSFDQECHEIAGGEIPNHLPSETALPVIGDKPREWYVYR